MTTRELIMQSALKHFLIEGYDYTSLNQIAEDVNIKKASIYYHFKNKEALLIEVVSILTEHLSDADQKAYKASDQAEIQIERWIENTIYYHQNLSLSLLNHNHELININALLYRARRENVALNAQIESFFAGRHHLIKTIINKGQSQGSINANLNQDIVAYDLLARLEGIIQLAILNPSVHLLAMRSQLYDSIWDSLKVSAAQNAPSKKKSKHYRGLDIARKW